MVERPLDHEHLRSIGGVPNTDQRCRLPDLVAHGTDATQAATGRGTTLMRMDARESVAHAIEDHGPITFAEYMTLALYGPGGFFETPPDRPRRPFRDQPARPPVFAELLGRAIVELRDRLGRPPPLRLSEVGAGDGTLARQLVEHFGDPGRDVHGDRSEPGARAALEGVDGVEVAEDSTDPRSLIIANELLDNLPFRRLLGTASGTKEIPVALEGDRFVEHLGDPPPGEDLPLAEGAEVVLPDGATAFIEEVGARLAHPGYALLIDYGGVGEPGGQPHGYRAHRPVEDLLDRPGETDITSGLDFDLLSRHAEAQGLIAFPSVTQRHALTALGFDHWVHEQLRWQVELLNRREGLDAVRTWSGRSRASLLVDPSALGRLRWLLLATPDLPAPAWM